QAGRAMHFRHKKIYVPGVIIQLSYECRIYAGIRWKPDWREGAARPTPHYGDRGRTHQTPSPPRTTRLRSRNTTTPALLASMSTSQTPAGSASTERNASPSVFISTGRS